MSYFSIRAGSSSCSRRRSYHSIIIGLIDGSSEKLFWQRSRLLWKRKDFKVRQKINWAKTLPIILHKESPSYGKCCPMANDADASYGGTESYCLWLLKEYKAFQSKDRGF